ncbi:phosphatases II [Cristinia sonorae]|uniref:protein-tyrosine-phosphatase n=1 Tax=Cristinia sonorae TaxID=1940300 RepID=A0A8K0UYC9_9AGAR|nr:phosphatases II [Cristinia sonorae]
MGWKNISTIVEGRLFLGTLEAAKSPRVLSERRITHIVSVGTEPIPADNPASGIRQLRVPIEDVDYADLLIHLPRVCHFIHSGIGEDGSVLVHCVQGLSRSAAVVAAYLMYAQQISSTAAINAVRQAREQVWINPGFQEQLVLFELCKYNPHPNDGIYKKWKQKIQQHIQ